MGGGAAAKKFMSDTVKLSFTANRAAKPRVIEFDTAALVREPSAVTSDE